MDSHLNLPLGRGLYAVLDLDRLSERGRDLLGLGTAVLRGGAAAIQVRCKRQGAGALLGAARSLAPICQSAGRPLVVNDRPDVAHLVAAWGVHLGQEDLPAAEARAVAPGLAVGVSTHSLAEVESAVRAGATYIGYGPVFETRTKERPNPVQGLDALRAAVRTSQVPVVAIGGIDLTGARDVARAGAHAAAAISAIDEADDPEGLAGAFALAFAAHTVGTP